MPISRYSFAVACALATALSLPAVARDLTIALAGNINTLDPDKSTTFGTDLSVISHLYTPLIDRGPDLKLRPGLATEWDAVNDTTWRFKLRPGVQFPDGEKLDAEALKWNIERVLDPKTGARNKPWFAPISEARVLDPQTIEIVTKEPYPDLPAQMSAFFLMPPKWTGENNPSVTALGSGPYDLVRYTNGDRVVLKAKKDYWGGPVPFDTVMFRIIPDESARIAAVLAGDVDLAITIPPSEMARVDKSGRAHTGSVDSTRPMFVKFNTLRPPFKDNPKLALALNYAIDKAAIVSSLWNGLGSLEPCEVLSPGYFGFNPDLKPIPYDPVKAKALLAEAGFPKGLSFTMEVPTGRYLQAQDIGQIIAGQLADIGVNVTLREVEFGAWLTRLNNGDMTDAVYFGLAWPTLDAAGLLAYWEHANPLAYYNNPDLERLLIQARSTTDAKRRLALYADITKRMCEAPALIYLFYQPVTYAESNSIKWSARGDDWVRAMDVVPR